jgi:hypothetical protein
MKQIKCDTLVIGAGASGVAAAIAAARQNVKTILVEKDSFPGGTAYAGMFQYICGLYLNGSEFPADTLNSGLSREISSLLKQASPDQMIKKIGRVYLLNCSPDHLKAVLTSLCESENNLTFFRNTTATEVDKNGAAIGSVFIDGPAGKMEIRASVVIDCSGDGDLSHMAGADFELSAPEDRQLAGYMVFIKGLKSSDDILSIKVPWHLADAVKRGLLPPLLRLTTFSLGDTPEEGCCKISIDGEYSPERDLLAERHAQAMLSFLSDSLPAFRDAFIAGKSLRTLNREGRRICGEYTLTEEDILSARKFPDGIVKNSWPIEFWHRTKGPVYKYLRSGDYYEIPFRCLMVRGIPNLLTAGRCISVTQSALVSTRVTGTCMALGEKAGIAAAHRIRNGRYPKGRF